ncbi:glycosyltransferase [Butyrivibrio sp. WCE2006]|uniref:glycosyltransferase n=1 Tax=Butyrivibrio sp. WCE2006 TaxID=1410611 RepID=UPI0005D1575F|nr:glycosyltransferase [Butyrivibrio sp. WCE2006]
MNKLASAMQQKDKIYKIYRKIRYPLYRKKKNRLYQEVENEDKVSVLVKTDRMNKIVVSLTTYAPRFSGIPLVVKSILLQSVLPDKIIIWCDDEEESLPDELLSLRKYGVEFKKAKDNLGPHKKYFYALQEYKDDIVILLDDDLVYPHDLIESLLKSYRKHPDCISARRVHKMKLDADDMISKYSSWLGEYDFSTTPSHMYMATTGAGTLIPPNIFNGLEQVFNKKVILDKCFYSDDIWLKYMEILNDIKVVWVPNKMPMPPEIMESQDSSLKKSNVFENRNDKYIVNMNELYGSEVSRILKEHKDSGLKRILLEIVEKTLGRPIYNWGK